MDLKKFIDNLKIKKLEKNQVLILFLCGVLLMIIAVPIKEKDYGDGKSQIIEYEGFQEDTGKESASYVKNMEQELEQMLSQMEGAGEVACMLTLSQTTEYVIEKDLEVSEDVVTETDSQGGQRTTNQSSRSETTIYNEKENGKPYVRKEILPKVEGVLVIADGGNNPVVVKNITESLQALFGIETHKIRIVKKGGY